MVPKCSPCTCVSKGSDRVHLRQTARRLPCSRQLGPLTARSLARWLRWPRQRSAPAARRRGRASCEPRLGRAGAARHRGSDHCPALLLLLGDAGDRAVRVDVDRDVGGDDRGPWRRVETRVGLFGAPVIPPEEITRDEMGTV